MASRSVTVTAEDWAKLIRRTFRGLNPKKVMERGEVAYDLFFSDHTGVRIWTSVKPDGVGAGVGEDAIRVTLYYPKLNRPAVKGKAKRAFRTTNWRDAVRKLVGEFLELYEEKSGYWDGRGGGEASELPPPPPPVPELLPEPPPVQEEFEEDEPRNHHDGTFSKLRDGSWGARITTPARPNDTAYLSRRSGGGISVVLTELVYRGQNFELWRFSKSRHASAEENASWLLEITKDL